MTVAQAVFTPVFRPVTAALFSLFGTFSPKTLFSNNEQGVWYDPSDLTTLFQDDAGTTPVTAVEQPVGLMLDKRDTAYSTYFDGSGDYLTTSYSTAAFDWWTNDYTLEAWIYPTSLTGWGYVHGSETQSSFIGNANTTSAINYWSFGPYTDGTVKFKYYNGASVTVTSTQTVNVGQWNHIAMTKTSSGIVIWVNGISNTATAVSGTPQSASYTPLVVGQINNTCINGYASNVRIVKGTAVYTSNFTPPTGPLTAVLGTSLLTCGTSWSGNPVITNNGNTRADKLNPFTTSAGNHAYQTTSANRPTLSARYNLLTKTEQFDDAVWKTDLSRGTVTTNITIAPDGTETADAIVTNGNSYAYRFQTLTVTNGASYTASVYMKKPSSNGTQYAYIQLNNQGNSYFDLVNGTVSSAAAGVTCAITNVGNGWYRCSCSATSGTTSGQALYGLADASGNQGAAGTGTSIYIWGADLRVANDGVGIPAYQRVNTATDYDTGGFPKYLRFNGSSSAMVTNTITPGTDKAQMFAGVRKLSDASVGAVIEVGDIGSVNNGVSVLAPQANATGNYRFGSGGSAFASAIGATYSAPITNILTGIGDISGDSAILRVNGTQVASSSTDQGTGNYGNYPLYIGARAGTSLWFNGRVYSMVVRFGSNMTTAQITNTEKYVNSKTKAY